MNGIVNCERFIQQKNKKKKKKNNTPLLLKHLNDITTHTDILN